MEWLAMQFQGRAADHWVRVVGAARVTATTSGIGHNSVLYRCLRDMLLAYPATGIKANLLLRKVRDLPWKSKATVEQICITTTAYYEAYQRAVALTQHLDVTLLVPDQDWPTRFTEMQAYFPEWATKLVVDYPGRFNNEQACWTALVAEASRKAAGKAMGAGGGLSQLTGVCTAGDLDDRDAYVLPAGFPASGGIYYGTRSTLSMVAFTPCAGLPVAGAVGPRTIFARTARIRRRQPSSRALPSISGPRCRLDPARRRRGLRVRCRVRCSCARSCLRRRRAWPRSPTTPRRRTSRTSSQRSTPSTCRLPCRARPWHPCCLHSRERTGVPWRRWPPLRRR